jgi:hypothetical protein
MEFSMTRLLHLASALLISVTASGLNAAELKGAQLVEALNGQSFSCKFKKSAMEWVFERSDPDGTLFPYTVTLDGKEYKAAYKLLKNGKVRHSKTNKSRKLVQNADGSLTISGSGVPTTHCVRR